MITKYRAIFPDQNAPQTKIPTGEWFSFRERDCQKNHDVFLGAPCEWSELQGATHTLDCGIGHGRGTRPAIMKKTVLYVGIDEHDDKIVWEKWLGKVQS